MARGSSQSQSSTSTATRPGPAGMFRRRHNQHAPSSSRQQKQLYQHRHWRRQQQHAEVLHGRRPGAEDFADGGARDEPLLHRLRHRAPRVRQTLPLQIWWRRLIFWRCSSDPYPIALFSVFNSVI
ncbi:hypothetical protein glysoja_042482 [Glycine soja]|uniref:Uncharacterized protein n=1 Tax=Glycine soja TaxID=3848 RepID=A0A0B2QZG0_GLYSO|nr:hypothetical protein glysoja_042482 [Glycine soja]